MSVLPARRETVALAPAPSPAQLVQSQAPSWLANLQVSAEIAKSIADTSFVPGWCRHDVPAVTAVIMKGLEIGLPPMASLGVIVLIDGKPAIYAAAQRALVTARGHAIWPEERSRARAVWLGRRAGDERVIRVEWTIEDARIARLSSKAVWQAYPRHMLSARCSAELVGAIFADVVLGLAAAEEFDIVPSELLAEADQPAAPTTTRQRPDAAGPVMPSAPATTPTPARARRARPPLPNESAPVDPVPPAEPEEPQRPSQAMMRRLQALMSQRGWNREQRLGYASIVTDRAITSSNELTADEASRIIDLLAITWDPAAGGDLAPIAEQARIEWLDATLRTLDPTDRELLTVAALQRADVGAGEVVDGALLARICPDLAHVPGESLADAYGRLLHAVEPAAEVDRAPEAAAPERERPVQGELDPPPRRRTRRRQPPVASEPPVEPPTTRPTAAPSEPDAAPAREDGAAGEASSFPHDLDDLKPRHEQPTLAAGDDRLVAWRVVLSAMTPADRSELASLLYTSGLASTDYGSAVDGIADVLVLHLEADPSREALAELRAHLDSIDPEASP